LKKALHEEKEPFLLHKKGELIGWGISDVKNLIDAANAAVINEEAKSRKLTYDEYFKIIIHDWFEILVTEGISEKVIKHLNARIQHIRFHHVLKHSEKGLPYWRYIADSNSVMSDPELQSAYGITHLLAIGALSDLKRCGLKDCQNYFIGRSNVRWCSKPCGSLYRVRQKRKRDKS
jgi:predicted RNA-binding Zn ribbon-like protein